MAADEEDIRDAAMFRFWIRMAAMRPGQTALVLAYCHTAEDYRRALYEYAQQECINLPGTPQ